MPAYEKLCALITGERPRPRRAHQNNRTPGGDESMSQDRFGGRVQGSISASEQLMETLDQGDLDSLESEHHTSEVLKVVLEDHDHQLERQQLEYEKLQVELETQRNESQQLRKERDDARQQCDKLKRRHEIAGAKYKQVLASTILPYAQAKGLHWGRQTSENQTMVLKSLLTDAEEADGLRIRVGMLQNEMLAKRDNVQALPDEQLAQDFRSILALIKSLARTVRPSQGVDITKFTGPSGLLRGADVQAWGVRARKKYLIEAWTWSVLCDFVFRGPFGVFGEEGQDLMILWKGIFGHEHIDGWPTPSASCESWRYCTSEQLAGKMNPTTMSRDSTKDGEWDRNLDVSIMTARKHVYSIIMAFVSTICGGGNVPEVGQIVDNAFDLALQMSHQRARLQVTYPSVGARFHGTSMKPMEDSSDDEDSHIETRTISFVVNPGLTKWGDAYGKNLDQRYDIVPSLVEVEADGPAQGILLY
ncbi:hypothetical protein N0V95_001877 [Ascochyta clinopodiicola]|nr:hypothetical protein N0V95_001877 [Ascochyta clinopodiicola]